LGPRDEAVPVRHTGNLPKGVSARQQKKSTRERPHAHTSEGLDAKPEHGEDNSRYDAEVAEPETERRPVKNREGDMKSSTNSSVEGDDDSNDGVPESYRRKSLSPETPSSTSYFHPGREKKATLTSSVREQA
jgi:hypothetical protein